MQVAYWPFREGDGKLDVRIQEVGLGMTFLGQERVVCRIRNLPKIRGWGRDELREWIASGELDEPGRKFVIALLQEQ